MFDANIWLAAAGQILFSLSLGWGVVSTYSSYLPEDTQLIKNGAIVAVANCGFEFFTAIGVFSILGFMSLSQGVPIQGVITQGSGLIFVAFPTVFNIMGDFAYILAPLFFLCVLFAGITTTISLLEPISLGITRKFKIRRKVIVTVLCIIGFGVSLVYATGLGNYLLTIADNFLNEFAVLFGIVLECLTFGWLYNTDKLLDIVNKNATHKFGRWWIYLIKYIIPIIFIALWLNGIYTLITTNSLFSIIVQGIFAAILILVPTILTLLPKSDKKLEIECD